MMQCGVCSLEILGTGALGTQPSVVASTDNDRILFECGDGTQRLCTENGVRVSKISRIYLSRNSPLSNGGLGGFLLTRSDLASCERTTVVGPPGTTGILKSFRYFYQRPNRTVSVFEIGADGLPDKTEDGITITPLLVGGSASSDASENMRKKGRQEGPTEVLRGFELHESVMPVCQEGDLEYATSYLIELPERRGKFHPDRAVALGVKPGRDFGRLTKGESITLANGKIIRPEDCMDDMEPPPKAMIVNCPTLEHLDRLMALSQVQHLAARNSEQLLCMVHISPAEVIRSPTYQAWARNMGEKVSQLALGEGLVPEKSLYRSSCRLHARLSALDADAFPLRENSESQPMGMEDWIIPESKARFILLPARLQGYSTASVAPQIDVAEEIQKARELLGRGRDDEANETAAASSSSNNDKVGPNVLFLGTGSAIPSKYRNVSALMVFPRNESNGPVLVDCGEGSVGQIARSLGTMAKCRTVLSQMSFVWISHMHADHHLGLLTVLSERAKLDHAPNLIVAGPTQLNSFLKEYGKALGGDEAAKFLGAFTFLDNEAMLYDRQNEFQPPALRALNSAAGLVAAISVPVIHCYKAYGLVLESHEGWKFVYSGDTEFCQELIARGMNATLLVHEATFEDGKEDEAKEKKHSTVSQALQTATSMNAEAIAFSHFSQRYPKNPPLPSLASSVVAVFAFDLMEFSPDRASRLSVKAKEFDRLLEDEAENFQDGEEVI